MAMASYGGVVVGKAGTTTMFEAISRKCRLAIDNVRPSFFSQGFIHFCVTCVEMILRQFGFEGQIYWEKDNTRFTKKHGLAESFKNESEFLNVLDQILNNDGQPVQHGIELKNVETEIPRQLKEMLSRAEIEPGARHSRQVRQNL